jgi:hypothetical protein
LIRSAYCSASRLYTPYASAWMIESNAGVRAHIGREFDE